VNPAFGTGRSVSRGGLQPFSLAAVKQPSRQILPTRGLTIDLGEPW
jgi:hypothetical protein